MEKKQAEKQPTFSGASSKDSELKKLVKLSDRELMMELRTTPEGLTSEDAKLRLEEFGPNEVAAQKPRPAWKLLLHAFQDPFVYVLALLLVVFSFNRRP